MELWKINYAQILSINVSRRENTQTKFNPLLLKWGIALLTKSPHSIYKEIAQIIHSPSLSYVLKNTKEMVRSQYVRKDCGVTLSTIQTMSKKLIDSDNEENISKSFGFDNIQIKAGLDWDINQSKIGRMNHICHSKINR